MESPYFPPPQKKHAVTQGDRMFSVPKFVFPKVKRNSYTTSRNTLLILYTTRRPTSSHRDRRSGRTEYPAICCTSPSSACPVRHRTSIRDPFPCPIGEITAAVPQAAHSSNVESSSTATGRSSTFIPISFANCRRLLLVIEGRIEVDFGVM